MMMVLIQVMQKQKIYKLLREKIRVTLFELLFFFVFFLYRSNDTSFSDEDRLPSEHLTHCQDSSVCVLSADDISDDSLHSLCSNHTSFSTEREPRFVRIPDNLSGITKDII